MYSRSQSCCDLHRSTKVCTKVCTSATAPHSRQHSFPERHSLKTLITGKTLIHDTLHRSFMTLITGVSWHSSQVFNTIESHERWWHHELSGLCSSSVRENRADMHKQPHAGKQGHRVRPPQQPSACSDLVKVRDCSGPLLPVPRSNLHQKKSRFE